MSLFLVNQILDRPDPFKPLSHTKFLPLLACTLQLQLQYQEIQFINYTHSCHDFSNYHVFPFLLPLLLFSNRFLLLVYISLLFSLSLFLLLLLLSLLKIQPHTARTRHFRFSFLFSKSCSLCSYQQKIS